MTISKQEEEGVSDSMLMTTEQAGEVLTMCDDDDNKARGGQ